MGGVAETFRVPLYPLLLAALTLGHKAMWPIAAAQAAFGAGTVVCAALLAQRVCSNSAGKRAAILAAGITALYPYYVVHDTALEETSLFTLLTIAAVIALMEAACRQNRGKSAALAGAILGLDVLTRASIAPFAALAPIWLLWRRGVRAGILCGLTLTIVILPWVWRNYSLVGIPTLSAEAGELFWTGNNGFLFRHYPEESSDISKEEALQALSAEDQEELRRLSRDDLATDRWFWHKAWSFIRQHPGETLEDGIRKNLAAFSLLPSPRHGKIQNVIYTLSYGPAMLVGLLGMWQRRKEWRDDAPIYLAFTTFVLVTTAFWAHTSHRSYLDVYWIVFGALAVAERTLRSQDSAQPAES